MTLFRLSLIATLIFFIGLGMGLLTVNLNPSSASWFLSPKAIHGLQHGVLWTDGVAYPASTSWWIPLRTAMFLFLSNLTIFLKIFFGGLLFGVGGLGFLFYNGFFGVGGPLGVCIQHGMGERFIHFMMPHVLLELVPMWIAGGLEIKMGFSIWQRTFKQCLNEIIPSLLACIPLLLLAALIESFVSLSTNSAFLLRLTVCILSIPFLYFYLKWKIFKNKRLI